VVGRAYLDQLTRTSAIPADRAAAVKAALDKKPAAAQIETLAGQLESDAGKASGADASRLRELAKVLRAI